MKFIKNGESVVLLCLGDTSLFASSSNILRLIKNNSELPKPYLVFPQFPQQALNDFDLVKKGETLIIKECPSSESELSTLIRKVRRIKRYCITVGKRWNLVKEILKKEDIINTSLIALSVGMPDQIIQYASQYKKNCLIFLILIGRLMYKRKLVENQFTWPICRDLLFLVLEDKVSDVFVCKLVWERLFYTKELSTNDWVFRY